MIDIKIPPFTEEYVELFRELAELKKKYQPRLFSYRWFYSKLFPSKFLNKAYEDYAEFNDKVNKLTRRKTKQVYKIDEGYN